MGIINEEEPDADSAEIGSTTLSLRPSTQESISPGHGVEAQRTLSTVPEVTPGTSNRAMSKGLTPGPLLSALMHPSAPDDDSDDDLPAAARSGSYDITKQRFSTSARPTMSPAASQHLGVLGRSPSNSITPVFSAPREVHSLLSGDDVDSPDDDNDEKEQIAFPLFSVEDVHKNFAHGAHRTDKIDGRGYDDSDDNFSVGGSESIGSLEGELVGIGHATPLRFGDVRDESVRPVS